VIRWLVEQQNIGCCKQQTRKTETILLAAGKFLRFKRPHIAFETETLKNRLRFRAVFKTAFELKFMLQIAVTLENFVELVAGIGHAMLKIVHLVFDLLESTKGSECRLVDRRTRLEMNMLVQQSQLQTTSAHDVAAIGSLVTPDKTKDRAFARSVSTY